MRVTLCPRGYVTGRRAGCVTGASAGARNNMYVAGAGAPGTGIVLHAPAEAPVTYPRAAACYIPPRAESYRYVTDRPPSRWFCAVDFRTRPYELIGLWHLNNSYRVLEPY